MATKTSAKRILLIDDDSDFCELMQRFMAPTPFEVVVANDVPTAISHLEAGGPLCGVIVDFWLGNKDSVPVLDKIAALFPKVPVVLVSGGNDSDFSIESAKAVGELSGALHFLQKPFLRADLLDIISSLD